MIFVNESRRAVIGRIGNIEKGRLLLSWNIRLPERLENHPPVIATS